MLEHVLKVIEFNTDAGNPLSLKLCAELVNEECRELVQALGYDVNKRGEVVHTSAERLEDASIVKEACDCHVVVTGVLQALGLTAEDADVCQQLVDDNNLLKVGTGSRGASGKLIKAENHPSAVLSIAEYLEGIRALRSEPEAEPEAEPKAAMNE